MARHGSWFTGAGAWQNNKGALTEVVIQEIILWRSQEREIISGEETSTTKIELGDGRMLVFVHEPDVAIYQNDVPQVAVEVKGGVPRLVYWNALVLPSRASNVHGRKTQTL